VGDGSGKYTVLWGELGIEGRIILTWIFRKWDEGMDCIDLAQDRSGWRPLLNTVMSLLVP